jgi:hypothetical protein
MHGMSEIKLIQICQAQKSKTMLNLLKEEPSLQFE